MPILSRRAALALALSATPAIALAQAGTQAGPARIRGTIVRFAGEALEVAARDGARTTVTLPRDAIIAALRRVTLADIKPGTNVGVVAEPDSDGALRATAITVLPPGAQIRQLQSPWDTGANASMNNGVVEATVANGSGRDLTLTILGRDVLVRVPATTPLLMPVPASREDLKPDATVFINATRGADGRVTASRVIVSRDGVAPVI